MALGSSPIITPHHFLVSELKSFPMGSLGVLPDYIGSRLGALLCFSSALFGRRKPKISGVKVCGTNWRLGQK